MEEQEGGCGLFLVVEAGESAVDRLTAALAAAPVASVVIASLAGQTLNAPSAKPLVDYAQSRGAAALLLDDADLARQVGADGVHLSHGKEIESRYRTARQTLGRNAIVGAHAGKSRHDAMVLAEEGAEYVAFGIPAAVQDREAARERRLDLVAWWAEIFEVPCVALDAETPEEATELARAGVDFIGINIAAGTPLSEISRRVKAIASALETAPAD